MRIDYYFEKEKELKKKMMKLGVHQSDIKEDFIRSSGPGGQNINKVSTCVVLEHIPTGIRVKCQKERSQSANRQAALRMLVEKIEHELKEAALLRKQLFERERRRSRKKPLNLKEEILRKKHIRSERKMERKKITELSDLE